MRCFLLAVAAALLPGVCASQAAPPRSVAGILAVLEAHKPDPDAVKALQEAAKRAPPAGADRVALKRFYVERADARARLGMVHEQVADREKALEFAHASDGDEFEMRVGLANAAFYAGEMSRSIKLYAEAAGKAQNPGQRIMAQGNFAVNAATYGDFDSAQRHLELARSIFTQVSNDFRSAPWRDLQTSNLERTRGNVALRQGKYADAEALLKTSILHQLRYMNDFPRLPPHGNTEVGNRRLLNRVEGTLAVAQMRQGKLVEAEATLRAVLERLLKDFGRYSPDTALAVTQLSSVIFQQGRYGDAAALANAALETYEALGVHPATDGRIWAHSVLGGALAELARYAESDAVFSRRRAAIEADPERAERLGWETMGWAHALVRLGRAAEAVGMTKRIYERSMARFGDAFYATAEARGYYALALAAQGERQEALAHFRAALPLLLKEARIAAEGEVLTKSRRLVRLLHAYIALLAQLHGSGEAPKDFDAVAEAFRAADAARGSRVQMALSASAARAAIRDPELEKLAREAQDGSQRIGSLTAILLDLLSRPPAQQLPQVIATMRRDVEQLKTRQDALAAEIRRRFPDYASLVDPQPVSLEEARKALKPGESLVSLLSTEDQTFVWALPHAGAASFAVVKLGAAERHDVVRRLRKALESEGGALLREIPPFDLALAHDLYRKLLVPVHAGWKDASALIVVPHGGLGQLPFALLPTAPAEVRHEPEKFEGYRQVPWLVRQVALTQLPSVTSLVSLRAGRVARAPSRSFAGFGDPVFGKEAPKTAAVALAGLASRSVYAPGAKLIDSAQLADLPPLPDTADEVREIAKALRAEESSDVFLGTLASERRVKSMDLSDRRVVLFATHGLIPGDLDGLAQPALALSNPAVTGDKDDDGLLALDEIVTLKLNADLVVLSACNTASGDGEGAEAVSGLGRAFFYAGARALLVSNWPVESVSARLLTTDLFSRVVREPQLDTAEALRRSMLALMDDGVGKAGSATFSYAHPMFWAPFTLVGDGRRR